MKVTARTAQIVARSGIGSKLELTDADQAKIDARRAEQAARLARIAERQASRD